ncbi:hypothetical protein Scep_014489 [Stephania cephalantha]|uniref:Uncharacterized protein n=1 Tax=Stephania cephalantha TaxID=152367 RepID=A0AAP0J386_9MAGN
MEGATRSAGMDEEPTTQASLQHDDAVAGATPASARLWCAKEDRRGSGDQQHRRGTTAEMSHGEISGATMRRRQGLTTTLFAKWRKRRKER